MGQGYINSFKSGSTSFLHTTLQFCPGLKIAGMASDERSWDGLKSTVKPGHDGSREVRIGLRKKTVVFTDDQHHVA